MVWKLRKISHGERPNAWKREILLHCLGMESQQIFASFTNSNCYDGGIATLRKHFKPKHSVMMQWYRLRQLAQLPGESVTQFLASLAELASLCKFGDLQDEMIHDQIIEKTSIPRIRERLLTRCARHSTAAAKPATKSSAGQTKTCPVVSRKEIFALSKHKRLYGEAVHKLWFIVTQQAQSKLPSTWRPVQLVRENESFCKMVPFQTSHGETCHTSSEQGRRARNNQCLL